jgi:site-specific DNA-methyltransferase (adenine-specific)
MMHTYGFKKSDFQIDEGGQYTWVIAKDWWEIPSVGSADKQRLGYPTQKPLALLERIIKASSNKGNTVLDPFCGCGTTIDAAQKLGRRWLGIDVTWLAIDLVEKRLKATYGAKITSTYEVKGKPYDVASAQALANRSKKEFEIWVVTLVGAAPRECDGGVDGIFGFVEKDKKTRTIMVQVKGGDVLNPGMVRDLIGTVKKERAAIGLLVTLQEPTKGMTKLAVHSEPYKSELWDKEFPSIQIRTVGELLEGKGFDLPPTQRPLKNAQLAKEIVQQIHQGI